jgi:hypothetical protein
MAYHSDILPQIRSYIFSAGKIWIGLTAVPCRIPRCLLGFYYSLISGLRQELPSTSLLSHPLLPNITKESRDAHALLRVWWLYYLSTRALLHSWTRHMQCTILGNIKASLIRSAIYLIHNSAGEDVPKSTDITNLMYAVFKYQKPWASVDGKEHKAEAKQEVS